MAQHIKNLLGSLLDFKGIHWHMSLIQQWPILIGALHNRVHIQRIQQDVLILGVYETHWIQELFLLSHEIIESVNTFLKEPKIRQVRFVVIEKRQTLQKITGKSRAQEKHASSLTNKQKDALLQIQDDQLKVALTDFWQRCTDD